MVKKKRPRSRKNQTRRHVCDSFLWGIRGGLGSGHWDLNPKSFREALDEVSPPNPLAGVVFDPDTRRYVTTDDTANAKEDDAIAQAMVVYLLHRLEKGWGNLRSFQALSVWMGKEPKDNDENNENNDDFPLENLWKKDMELWIETKQLGKTTMAHPDNWDQFPRFYSDVSRAIWARRSNSMRSKLHELSEQACIRMAKHLSDDYSILAAQFLDFCAARRRGLWGRRHGTPGGDSLYQSALKGTNNFPKTAFDDLSGG